MSLPSHHRFQDIQAGSEAGHSRVKIKKINDDQKYDRIKEGLKKFNIDATPTLIINDKKFSSIDIVEKITKQLHKLIDIIKVNDISDDNIVSRELALIKVNSDTKTRSEIMQIVAIYRAKIVDVSSSSIIIEATGDDQKIQALQNLLSSFGLVEVMRTGLIAMNREKNK